MKQDNNLLKKKYNKKQLKEYFSKNRSIIGLSKNLSTISGFIVFLVVTFAILPPH